MDYLRLLNQWVDHLDHEKIAIREELSPSRFHIPFINRITIHVNQSHLERYRYLMLLMTSEFGCQTLTGQGRLAQTLRVASLMTFFHHA